MRGGCATPDRTKLSGDVESRAERLESLSHLSCGSFSIGLNGLVYNDGTSALSVVGDFTLGDAGFVYNGVSSTDAATLTVNVLQPLRIAFQSPLSDDNVANDINTDADVGNVFADTKIRLDHLRYGIGAGVRYVSPVGPIRFDVGYKLNRRIWYYDEQGKAFFERPFAYSLTLGYAF